MAIGIDNTKPDSVNLEILTLVNNETAEAMPWLHEAVLYN